MQNDSSKDIWHFISGKISKDIGVILMAVLESEGSSPGRQGFKMAVAADGDFIGTIGGGIMEHKLTEKARSMLSKNEAAYLLVRQYHDKQHPLNQSGMICSGSQTIGFIPLNRNNLQTIESFITTETQGTVVFSPEGIALSDEKPTGFIYTDESTWRFSESLHQMPVIHIVGAGHVGLALSELMHYLGFYIKIYDDRPELNTLLANSFAAEKHVVSYDEIGGQFNAVEHDFAVIMTIGYRTDKIVLKQLIHQPFFYLGLLGSKHKIKTLFNELKDEGLSEELLSSVCSPVGINIAAKTAREIAVSIAAEIIKKKNEKVYGRSL